MIASRAYFQHEEPEGDPTERLNLDDYNSDDFNKYLSDNKETTRLCCSRTPTVLG